MKYSRIHAKMSLCGGSTPKCDSPGWVQKDTTLKDGTDISKLKDGSKTIPRVEPKNGF
jgi:hypothetical protein